MSRIVWDATGERVYETGVDRGVLFLQRPDGTYDPGIPWNGLRSVSQSPEGGEDETLWADNIKYLTLRAAEELNFSIGAYSSPDEFDECDGSIEVAPGVTIGQQNRTNFGFAYRSIVGNDTQKDNYGYKIHIYYGCSASPSDREYNTVNDSPEAAELSWDCSTIPVAVPGHKPTASVTIDSTKVDAEKLKSFEDMLYGTDEDESQLPSPAEIMAHFSTSGAAAG